MFKDPKIQKFAIQGMARDLKMALEIKGDEYVLFGPKGHEKAGDEIFRGNFEGTYRLLSQELNNNNF